MNAHSDIRPNPPFVSICAKCFKASCHCHISIRFVKRTSDKKIFMEVERFPDGFLAYREEITHVSQCYKCKEYYPPNEMKNKRDKDVCVWCDSEEYI